MDEAKTLYQQGEEALQKREYHRAIEFFGQAAERGYARAELALGKAYYLGPGVPQNFEKAFSQFQRARETVETLEDKAEALYYLAQMLRSGFGVKKDVSQAVDYLERAVALGNCKAAKLLGRMYAEGMGVEVDGNKAVAFYERVANEDFWAMMTLGEMYAKGIGVSVDGEKAVAWYEKAASLETDVEDYERARAMSALSEMYQKGIGVKKDKELAEVWSERAFDTVAKSRREMFKKNEEDVKGLYQKGEEAEKARDYKRAILFFKQSAGLGYAPAYRRVSVLCNCFLPFSREQNRKEYNWMRRGAEAGDPVAMCELATWLLEGHLGLYEFRKDMPQAFQWAQRAYETFQQEKSDASEALFLLAKMYRNGYGVGIDKAKGLDYRIQAAELGHLEATKTLAKMYLKGIGGAKKDVSQTIMWYEKAAEAGDFEAMKALGEIYDKGIDVEADKSKAAAWYEKAVQAGDKEIYVGDGDMFCDNERTQEQKQTILMKLSDMYENGIGVEQDREKAVELRKKVKAEKKALRMTIHKIFKYVLWIAPELFAAGMRKFRGIFPFNAFMFDAEDIWIGLCDKEGR